MPSKQQENGSPKRKYSKRKPARRKTLADVKIDPSIDGERPGAVPAIINNGEILAESDSMSNHWERDGKITPLQEDTIRSFLGSYSREPFQRQLAKFLHCAPDRESIKAFANRNPDKWAKAVETFASLSGYTQKLEVDINDISAINRLSDSQVEQRLAELEAMLHGTSTITQPVALADNEHKGK